MKKIPLKWWIPTLTIAFLSCAYMVGLFAGHFYGLKHPGIFWITVWMANTLLGLLPAPQLMLNRRKGLWKGRYDNQRKNPS